MTDVLGTPDTLSVPFPNVLGNTTHGIGFDAKGGVKRGLLRKTVDYGASIVRYLEVSCMYFRPPLAKLFSSGITF